MEYKDIIKQLQALKTIVTRAFGKVDHTPIDQAIKCLEQLKNVYNVMDADELEVLTDYVNLYGFEYVTAAIEGVDK